MKLVYRYRVKSLTGLLNQQARAVNFVWNYCNDRQKDALRFSRPWHSGFDLIRIANRRRDFLHKLSARMVRAYDYIVVGNVHAAALAKTGMAKSVLDASWSSFRNQLAYRAVKHGAWFEEVDERFTTQICSNCGMMPKSGPKGIADLGVREWRCGDCGAEHDRDLNAALNILRRGRATLAAGISVL